MDPRVKAVANEYEKRAADELRAGQAMAPGEMLARRDEFLLPVGAETATLMSLIIKGARSKRILEVGTSHGYSTLYLAEAAQSVGGKVTTIELAAEKSHYASAAIARAGLSSSVHFRIGNALEVLASLTGPFDFVLMDLWKELYVSCINLIAPKLASSAIVVGDNMLYPEIARPDAADYQRRVRELGLDSVLLNIGSGIEVSRKP